VGRLDCLPCFYSVNVSRFLLIVQVLRNLPCRYWT
jgi:hypothetical protein